MSRKIEHEEEDKERRENNGCRGNERRERVKEKNIQTKEAGREKQGGDR